MCARNLRCIASQSQVEECSIVLWSISYKNTYAGSTTAYRCEHCRYSCDPRVTGLHARAKKKKYLRSPKCLPDVYWATKSSFQAENCCAAASPEALTLNKRVDEQSDSRRSMMRAVTPHDTRTDIASREDQRTHRPPPTWEDY